MLCLLCHAPSDSFFRDAKREYLRCSLCGLIFVPPQYHISPSQEKKEYDQHENDPSDQKYRNFLHQAVTPLEQWITPGMTGLDFGSGPGPTLHLMLAEKGYVMEHYDPFFAPRDDALDARYDFVTATEVVEHFNSPEESWSLLLGLVKRGGYVAIMTLFWDASGRESFAAWWYKNIPSHVVFYSHKTVEWLAQHFSLRCLYVGNRVAVFQKL